MLAVEVLRSHLSDRHLRHLLRCHRMRAGESRTAVRLMRRIGERKRRSALVELMAHAMSASVVGRTKIGTGRVGHLTLVSLGIAPTATSLVMIATTCRTISDVMVPHIAVCGSR